MKTKLSIIFFTLILTCNVFARTETFKLHVGLDGNSVAQGYQTVHIYCSDLICQLICYVPDDNGLACTWDNATWCDECAGSYFNENNGQGMFDYVKDQVNNGTYDGIYFSNLFLSSNRYIYRTITWSCNIKAQTLDAVLTISE